eukprot:gnl/MRDRNA2_/MRDRNA2_101404_c0_seq1.p1 gnl/MRDRNA2_/MRDRNA2_101404_c0~~gnl/MRDRNA2_/MRDRNA2_101404_c0_seq1.p1  ORF type:complete len:348 (+),score=64.24 gnl/MRDRNA2_/MRDRNA2_101404_c0_seq1:62-1045(+)
MAAEEGGTMSISKQGVSKVQGGQLSRTSRAGLASSVIDGKIYAIGGHNGSHPLQNMECLDCNEGSWSALPGMRARRSYLSAGVIGGKIYAVGGSADGRVLNTMERYDPIENSWRLWFALPSMGTKRTRLAAAVAEGKLYVFGGFDGIRDLATTECYDPEHNRWHFLTSMARKRSDVAAAVLRGKIYGMGGQDRDNTDPTEAFDTVEIFDPYSELWNYSAPMKQGRLGLAAASLDGEAGDRIIAVGGSNGREILSSCEFFDPRVGKWEELPSMHVGRLGCSVAVVSGKIYALGGYDGTRPLDTVEVYDEVANQWMPPQPMDFPVVAAA